MGGGSSLLRMKLSMKEQRSLEKMSGFSDLVYRFVQRLFLLMLGGGIPERQGKILSGWVARKQPVMVRIALFKGTSTLCVCTLRHQAGAQYSCNWSVSEPEQRF